jgi:TolB-like protein
MGRWWRRALALGSVALVAPLQAQNDSPGFAVLPFENAGSYGQDKEIFEALELGIPATISAALSAHPGARVADSDRLRQALKSRGAEAAHRLDAATASQVAKAVGARYTVTGSFVDFYGKFRLHARLVDAESGQIVKVVSNDDPKLQDWAQLAAIIQSVSAKLATAAGLPPFPTEAAARTAAIPTDALNLYSRGLLYESRGDKAKASDWYQQALAAYPDYTQARDGLQRVRGG